MAGIDTIRGIAFQHAYAIQLALDVIDDAEAVALTIEGDADVIDAEITRTTSPARSIFQVKSRQEPYTWPPGKIAPVIVKWQEAGGGSDAPLRFASDGPASSETTNKLKPMLERAGRGNLGDEDRQYLSDLGIDPDRAAYVELATRSDGTSAQLAMAENRLRRLLALAGPSEEDAAERAVDRLFRKFSVEGGNQRIERRIFARSELSAILGLDLGLIDEGNAWTAEVANTYRSALAAGQTLHPWVELAALLDPQVTTPALSLQVTPDVQTEGQSAQRSAVGLVDIDRGAGLCGAAGTGKTTTGRQMASHAAATGKTALVVSAAAYRRGDLTRRARRALEAVVSRSLVPSAVVTALAEQGATLIVDGVTGLTAEGEDALYADLQEALERFPQLRLIVASREREFARRFNLPTHTLAPLSREGREAITAALVENAKVVVADLETTLGDVIDNPLLFVMAVALTGTGVAVTSRAEIFGGFLDGIRERAKETTVDETDIAALRLACVALVREKRFAADRYWWFATLWEALTCLQQAGIYDVDDRSAEAIFKRLLTIGILFEDDVAASVSLLHDAFRDYLASVALRRAETSLPRPVVIEWEQTIEFVAEQGGLTAELERALAEDNLVAATRAAVFDYGETETDLVCELTQMLVANHIGESPLGAEFGVVIVDGADHVYALIDPNGESGRREAVQAVEVAERAPFAVALPSERGSLAIATALWREFAGQLTATEPPSLLRAIPNEPAELAKAVAAHFEARRDDLAALTVRLFPTLANRITKGIGWTGLEASVDSVQIVQFVPGQDHTYHPLRYAFAGEDVRVEVEAGIEREFAARATAEFFVEKPSRDVAMKAIVDEVNRLLPEIV